MTDLLFLRDAYLGEFDAIVTAVDGAEVSLDRTAFYPTGGGQPHDTGALGEARVVNVRKDGDEIQLGSVRMLFCEKAGAESNTNARRVLLILPP